MLFIDTGVIPKSKVRLHGNSFVNDLLHNAFAVVSLVSLSLLKIFSVLIFHRLCRLS